MSTATIHETSVSSLDDTLIKLARADVLDIDTDERSYAGRDELRMILSVPELNFLIRMAPDQDTRRLLKGRGLLAFKNPQSIAGLIDGYPALKVYVPFDRPYLFPFGGRGRRPLTPIDMLYGLHQSPTLMAEVYKDLVHPETGEVMASAPTPLPKDLQWARAMLNLPRQES